MSVLDEEFETELPTFAVEQFAQQPLPECDIVMKGGVTSGIVYPYAVLQIATAYRFRSLGGTSAGAIAAAFAAAAEFGRSQGRPEAFLILKEYCDALPARLLSLFQPSPHLAPAVKASREAMTLFGRGGLRLLLRPLLLSVAVGAILGSVGLGTVSYLVMPELYPTVLAAILGGALGKLAGAGVWAAHRWKRTVAPVIDAVRHLPSSDFGFCTGLQQPGYGDNPGLTDWMHRAIQHIAFGDPDHPVPLTFGDLKGDGKRPSIDLKVVTTNLSMRRPHTLPTLGVPAGFRPADWQKLFPKAVMDYLYNKGTRPWKKYSNSWLFPQEDKLPVLVAVRMSLSFPVLFTAVPLLIEDKELPAIVKALGGKPYMRIRRTHFSDGGISSNFPIHMFDAPLPSRPTFAFSLEDLLWDPKEVVGRVALPRTASEGMGVQIKTIDSVSDFAWQILNAAKDWQDQLLSEITGQRERIARIFLTGEEGGLNLNMSAAISRRLMRWGYEAGCKFTDGSFDFQEHKWRRLLVLYKHLEDNLRAIDKSWEEGFGDWYDGYSKRPRSYRKLTLADRQHIAESLRRLVAARDDGAQIANATDKLPRKAGALKVAPKY